VVVSSSGTSLSPFAPAILMDEARVDGQLKARWNSEQKLHQWSSESTQVIEREWSTVFDQQERWQALANERRRRINFWQRICQEESLWKLRFEGPKCFDAINYWEPSEFLLGSVVSSPSSLFASWCWVKHDTKWKMCRTQTVLTYSELTYVWCLNKREKS
jgi:hypothetical protein